jgi:hypothetical protein
VRQTTTARPSSPATSERQSVGHSRAFFFSVSGRDARSRSHHDRFDAEDDDRPIIVQYVGVALREWPPLFSVEDDGARDDSAYVALRLDLCRGEYYPFSDLQERLDEYDIDATIVGIDTTSENDLPRLLLQVATAETSIDEGVFEHDR